jgi:Mitochondrial carrier protein
MDHNCRSGPTNRDNVIQNVYDDTDSQVMTMSETISVIATSSAPSTTESTSATTTSQPSANTNSNNSIVIPDMILQLPKEIRNIIAGGIAGMVAKSVVAPVDRIKILYQISAMPFHLRDVPKVAYNIIQQEGIIALWKGNMATMIRVFPYSGIQFMTFDFCKSYFLSQKHPHHADDQQHMTSTNHRIAAPFDPVLDPSSPTHTSDISNSSSNNNRHDRKYGLSPLESLVAGMIAGTVSVICTYPLDLVRAQLAVLKHNKAAPISKQQGINKNIVPSVSQVSTQIKTIPPNHGFVRVLNDNYVRGGIAGLFRGITPTLFGILPYSGIAFTLNEQGKREIQHLMGRDVTTMERLQCGAFSGLIAQTVTYPIEVTRRRMQTIGLVNKNDTSLSTCLGDNKGTNGTVTTAATSTIKASSSSTAAATTTLQPQQPPTLNHTITQLYTEQGVRGFLKGVSINWMKGPIAFAISFTTFDHMQHLLESPSERNRS